MTAPRHGKGRVHSRHGWFYRNDGTCERVKPCPEGTFRINNSDALYELCGSSPMGRRIYFRRVIDLPEKTPPRRAGGKAGRGGK